jgi:hypothetical protein
MLRALPHGHVSAVLGMVRKLDLPRLLLGRGRQTAKRSRDLALAMLINRIIAPGSKLATVRALPQPAARGGAPAPARGAVGDHRTRSFRRRRGHPAAAGSLKGAAAIGLALGAVADRHKVAKHFALSITDQGFTYRRKLDSTAAEARLDGL